VTLSAAAVYGIGPLLVLAAGAAVLLPRVELAVLALLVAVVLGAAFELFAGAALLAAAQLVAAGGPVLALFTAARRGRPPVLTTRSSSFARPLAGAAALLLAVALLGTLWLSGPAWSPGVPGGSLASALRHTGLVGLLTAIAGLVVCAAGALAIGREDPEEWRHERGLPGQERPPARARSSAPEHAAAPHPALERHRQARVGGHRRADAAEHLPRAL